MTERKIKPETVDIKKIAPLALPVPGAMGQISMRTQVYGLGDDNMLYVWDGEKKQWVLS